MAWCIVKYKEALGPPIGLLLEDVDRMVDLAAQIFSSKIPLTIFASFEYYSCFTWCVQMSEIRARAEERKDTPVSVTEATPLHSQEVRDHERLPIAFWSRCWG